jgi:hypothetical protein
MKNENETTRATCDGQPSTKDDKRRQDQKQHNARNSREAKTRHLRQPEKEKRSAA